MAVAAEGQASTKRRVVVQADIFFENETDTKEYNKYLQACIPAVDKYSYNDLQSFQPYNTPTPTAVNKVLGLPAILSSTFAVWFWNDPSGRAV